MTDNTQPEAGSTHIIRYALEMGLLWIDGDGRDKVREALAALDALEAQLSSSGFTAADMATASAQGFRDGAASAQQPAPSAAGPCVICGSDEPFTGTCGSSDPRALCKQPAPSAASKAVLAAIRAANMQLVRTGDDEFMLVTYKQAAARADSAPAALAGPMQFGGCPECGSRSCVARQCSRAVSHAAQAVPGVQWQCGPQASGFTAPQAEPVPAGEDASPSAPIAWNALRALTDPLGEAGAKIMGHVRIYAQRQYEAGKEEADRAMRAQAAPAAVAGPSDEEIESVWGHYDEGLETRIALARRILALAAPTQAPHSQFADGERAVPDTKCPQCGAPCKATVQMRGGEYGWGTSDLERTTYRYAAPQPAVQQGDALTPADADQLEKAITDFEECGETDVPDAALQRFAALGYLECVHYNVLPTAREAIDAARSQAKEGA